MQTPWEKTLDFHGRVEPELVLGFRAAEAGLRFLALDVADGERLAAVVENNGSGVDAIQVVTGCTLGQGNLVVRDWGKQVYTLIRRDNGCAVRVAIRPGVLPQGDRLQLLKDKRSRGELSAEEQRMLSRDCEDIADRLLEMPEEDLLIIKSVQVKCPPLPEAATTVMCANCGEEVMKSRTKAKDGVLLCPACYGA